MIARNVIYDAPQEKFFDDVLKKRIADIMQKNFEEITGRTTSVSEFNAWDRSLGEIKNLVELSKLTDLYFSFEYQVPYCQQRIDCLIFGKNPSGKGVVMHIELKQWQDVKAVAWDVYFVYSAFERILEEYAAFDEVVAVHDYEPAFGCVM